MNKQLADLEDIHKASSIVPPACYTRYRSMWLKHERRSLLRRFIMRLRRKN